MKLSKNEKYLNLTKIFFMEPIINIIVEEWLYELFWPKGNWLRKHLIQISNKRFEISFKSIYNPFKVSFLIFKWTKIIYRVIHLEIRLKLGEKGNF